MKDDLNPLRPLPTGHLSAPVPGGTTSFRCWRCKDSGTMQARDKRKPDALPYAFRCGCRAGELTRVAFPRFVAAEHWEILL